MIFDFTRMLACLMNPDIFLASLVASSPGVVGNSSIGGQCFIF